MNPTGLCFYLLNYKQDTHRHYYHIYEFIEALAQRHPVLLHIMDCEGEPRFKHVRAIRVFDRLGLRGRIRRMLADITAYMRGYRFFYHHYTTGPARFSALLCRLFGGKTFLWHCIVMEALDRHIRFKHLKRWMLKFTFHCVHHVVTGSSSMANYYEDFYSLPHGKMVVIPNYINLERFDQLACSKEEARQRLDLPIDRKVVLYLHEIEEGRARLLPEIIEQVFKSRPDTMFCIVGDGRYRQTLEHRLQRLIDQGRVRFVGAVPNTTTPLYYRAADVHVMTSAFEAFSRVLLEAMAMGTPYVSMDGGGNIRAYTPQEHQEYIVPVDRIDLFAQRVVRILEDPAEAQRLADVGLSHVQHYALARVLDRFEEVVFGKEMTVGGEQD